MPSQLYSRMRVPVVGFHTGICRIGQSCLFLSLCLIAPAVLAQQYTADQLKKHFQNVAEDYDIAIDGERLELRKSPIFFWTNNERELLHGSMYVWESDGCPRVLGSIFTYVWGGQTHCRHEFLSLTDRPVTATMDSFVVWSPPSSDLKWQAFPNAPTPSENRSRRLSQMRMLARRFSGTLRITGQQPSELRGIAQPLIRYEPSDQKVFDGAIFSYAVATDAEIMVLIEARRAPTGTTKYVFAAAPGHYHELELRLDGTQVWSAPTRMHLEARTLSSSEPYTIITPRQPLPAPEELR